VLVQCDDLFTSQSRRTLKVILKSIFIRMQLFKLTFSTFFLKINLVLFLVIGLLILISTLQVQSFDKKTLFIENRLNSIENHLEKIRGTNDEWENRRSKLRLQLNELEAKKALLASNNFIFRLLTDILIIPFIFFCVYSIPKF